MANQNYLFSSMVQNIVSDSVKRARIKSEQMRHTYATELIDTYSGFSKKYIDEIIDQKTKNETIKKSLKEMVISFPFLQSFIDEISMVYACQPKREFSLDGKEIVEELPEGADAKKYEVNKDLHELLEKIYGLRMQMQIKKAEVMTNLLQTTVYKVNNRGGQIKIDFVPNDVCSVASLKEDVTAMGAIRFLRNVSTVDQIVTPIYEQWDAFQFVISEGNKKDAQPNRAAELAESYWNSRVIESGIPPFCVFRTELPDDDFWNLKDQDLIETIKQINLAMTELRYLIRYSSFGLKYIANLDIVGEKVIDPLGIWNLKTTNQTPGSNQKDWEVGELKNEGRLADVVESIKFLITLLFQFYGINLNSLVGSGNVQSAESKAADKESVIRYIRYQKDIWQLNEEVLLKNIICVWNRDNPTDAINPNIEVKLCFNEDEEMADDLIKRAELWMLKIQNNVANVIDWIRSENPTMSDKDAEVILEKNKQINDVMNQALNSPIPAQQGDGQQPIKPGKNPLVNNGQQNPNPKAPS